MCECRAMRPLSFQYAESCRRYIVPVQEPITCEHPRPRYGKLQCWSWVTQRFSQLDQLSEIWAFNMVLALALTAELNG
jgi:hypothetical protein